MFNTFENIYDTSRSSAYLEAWFSEFVLCVGKRYCDCVRHQCLKMGDKKIRDIHIAIRSYTGKEYKLAVSDADIVSFVKKEMAKCLHIPTIDFHLTLNGKELKDHEMLNSVGIRDGSSLLLVPKIRGGPLNMKRVLPPEIEEFKKVLDKIKKEYCENLSSKTRVLALFTKDQNDKYHLLRVLRETDYAEGSFDEMPKRTEIPNNPDKLSSKLKETDTHRSLELLTEEMTMKLKICQLRQRMKEASEKKKNKKILKVENFKLLCDGGVSHATAPSVEARYYGKHLLVLQALSYPDFVNFYWKGGKKVKRYKHFMFRFVRQVISPDFRLRPLLTFEDEEQVYRFMFQKGNMDRKLFIVMKGRDVIQAQLDKAFENLKRRKLAVLLWYYLTRRGITFEKIGRTLLPLMKHPRLIAYLCSHPSDTVRKNSIQQSKKADETSTAPNTEKINVRPEPHEDFNDALSLDKGLKISEKSGKTNSNQSPQVSSDDNKGTSKNFNEPPSLQTENCMKFNYESMEEDSSDETKCSPIDSKQNFEQEITQLDETCSVDSQLNSSQGNSFWDGSQEESSSDDSSPNLRVDERVKGKTYEWLAAVHETLLFDLRLNNPHDISYEILAEIHDYLRLKIAEHNPELENKRYTSCASYKSLADLHGAVLRELKWSFSKHNPEWKEEDCSSEFFYEALAEFHEAMSSTISKQNLERTEKNSSFESDASSECSESDIRGKKENPHTEEGREQFFVETDEDNFCTNLQGNNELSTGESCNESLSSIHEQKPERHTVRGFDFSPEKGRTIFKVENPLYLGGDSPTSIPYGPIFSSPFKVQPMKSKVKREETKVKNDYSYESSSDDTSSYSLSSSHEETIDYDDLTTTVDNEVDDVFSAKDEKKEVVKLAPVVGRVRKSRCLSCKKRLNITNVYTCRCGNIYCAQHVHAELHNCSFDYKKRNETLDKVKPHIGR